MKYVIGVFFLTFITFSCSQKEKNIRSKSVVNIEKQEFQEILDSKNVKGTILIYNKQKNEFYSNNFKEAKHGVIPASTFKIPHSIIGLELGIIKDENTVFKWDGKERAYSIWEKDLILRDAFQKYCVPCYQELAHNIGAIIMKENIQKLKFGAMDVNNENIDNFWLMGKSKITPFQQIDFLTRFYEKKLPVSSTTTKIVKNIMKIETTENYILSGKTGLAVFEENAVGWFVGYVEKGGNIFYFATKISPIKMKCQEKNLR